MSNSLGEYLGIELLERKDWYARVSMRVGPEHMNPLGATHGGAIFALADEAFALACNTDDVINVAAEINIHFYRATKPGDVLTAEASVINQGRRLSSYNLLVKDAQDRLVASGMGLACKLSKRPG